MCRSRLCLCLCGLPLSVVVMLIAVMVPQLLPKDQCEVDATGACKRLQGGDSVGCDEGVFVELARQPTLGLVHMLVGKAPVAFASLEQGGQSTTYSLACSDAGSVVVLDSSVSTSASLGSSWEVCAKGAELRLLSPAIDLTYDIDIRTGQQVEGCVRISAPKRLSHLGGVRGSTEEQRVVLKDVKNNMGGCPTWTSDEDQVERGWDFISFGRLNSWFVRQHMKRSKALSVQYGHGFTHVPDGWGIFYFMGVMASGGITSGTTISPLAFCGVPVPALLPSVNAIQVTRHAEVAELIADPNQKRRIQIGFGASEVCFEPTLPVFLSAGEPAHKQTRKLWDAAGLATMHEADIPDIDPQPEGTFMKIRRAALSAVGLDAPLLDEVALYVAPLFLERLWGKRPTAEEAATIGQYGTFGGPCIMSPILEKLPILPGKVLGIRKAALAFARDSPVGKQMTMEINKPEYKELRELYASRPMGVADGALGALADASLFAGLIGTSTMTMNTLVQIHRGPKYVAMFRQNSTAFVLEVMRTATAVAGSLHVTKKPWELTMAGERATVPPGSAIFQATGFAAGLDASVFPDPYRFDSTRTNLGETMNFNGLTKHVLSKSYEGAPRFCPGAEVAIKIAIKIAEHFSKDLKAM